ncbi:hypothetical protein Taro_046428 [Colocasia esculenta]|uniref:Uncharacterized protein n=1 Tax=Colocasia esculenta TaxID=4460 RepID=A0A843WPW3_COLES|nr:hypothetical protein [Colocasia esculenta]
MLPGRNVVATGRPSQQGSGRDDQGCRILVTMVWLSRCGHDVRWRRNGPSDRCDRTALSGVKRTRVNATWSSVAIAFPVFERIVVLEASVLRWCRPARIGDVFVPFGVRRRRPFLREGPNGFVLHVEVRLLSSGRARTGWRRRGDSRSPRS